MLFNDARSWINDRVRSHLARRALGIGRTALRVKLFAWAAVAIVVVVLVGGFFTMAVGAVMQPLNAVTSFLGLSSDPEEGGAGEEGVSTDGEPDEVSTCVAGRADPTFTDLVGAVPAGLAVDVATGWLIYAAPHQGRPKPGTPAPMTVDSFEQAWSEVITGSYVPASTGTPRPRASRRSPAPETVLEVVQAIDPTVDYSRYADQAYLAAVYLLMNDKVLPPPERVSGSLIGGLAQACAEGGSVPAPPLLSHAGGEG